MYLTLFMWLPHERPRHCVSRRQGRQEAHNGRIYRYLCLSRTEGFSIAFHISEKHTVNVFTVICVCVRAGGTGIAFYLSEKHNVNVYTANSGIYVHVVFLGEVKRNAGAFGADTTQITVNTFTVCFSLR